MQRGKLTSVNPYAFIHPAKHLYNPPEIYMDHLEKPRARYTISGNFFTWSNDFISCYKGIYEDKLKHSPIVDLIHLFTLPKFYSPLGVYMQKY